MSLIMASLKESSHHACSRAPGREPTNQSVLPVHSVASNRHSQLECCHVWRLGWFAVARNHCLKSPRHSLKRRPVSIKEKEKDGNRPELLNNTVILESKVLLLRFEIMIFFSFKYHYKLLYYIKRQHNGGKSRLSSSKFENLNLKIFQESAITYCEWYVVDSPNRETIVSRVDGACEDLMEIHGSNIMMPLRTPFSQYPLLSGESHWKTSRRCVHPNLVPLISPKHFCEVICQKRRHTQSANFHVGLNNVEQEHLRFYMTPIWKNKISKKNNLIVSRQLQNS